MTRQQLFRASVFTLGLLAISMIAVVATTGRFTWGPPERPKNQAEALNPATVRADEPVDLSVVRYRDSVPSAVIREPQNTWSNFAFIAVGAFIFFGAVTAYDRFLGAATICVGIASGLYHASLLPFWRTVDVAGMAWTSAALALVGANSVGFSRRMLPSKRTAQVAFSAVVAVAAIVAAVLRNDVRIAGVKPFDSTYTTVAGIVVIFLFMISMVILSIGRNRFVRGFATRLAVLGVLVALGVMFQIGDHPGRIFCRPDSPVQAHAIWHLLMAAALGLAHDTFHRFAS